MESYIKKKPIIMCGLLFAVCLCFRFVEYFLIRTDESVIGENLIHKVIGIILLFVALKVTSIKWNEIGFCRFGFWKYLLQGLSLSIICFAISYGIEMLILFVQDNPAHLEFYISSFSLTGSTIKNTGINFFLLCIAFKLINVWMEEGVFRGFFIKTISDKYSFVTANLIAAQLFGIWHFAMPIRSFMDGKMEFSQMLLLVIGYIILSGVMSIKWGLLYRMTGNIWFGFADHFINNTIATNMLHVVANNEADELQIVRIVLAQIISFIVVMIIYGRAKKSLTTLWCGGEAKQ